jgi:hypothetical protein
MAAESPATLVLWSPEVGLRFNLARRPHPFPLLDITTTATGLLCWRDLHPLKRQLASLHLLGYHYVSSRQLRTCHHIAFWPPCAAKRRPEQVQQNTLPGDAALYLLDDLVGGHLHDQRHREAECLRRFEIDDEFDLGRLHHGKLGGLLTLEDAIDIEGHLAELVV